MKPRVATIWLEGCSGCHMSLLDMDERLVELADKMEVVYSPLMDIKEFPENVDVTLVEGAVNTAEDLEKVRKIRAHTRLLVSFGDCAVTANVPSMRNEFALRDVLHRAYVEHATLNGGTPTFGEEGVPPLLPRARPVHEFVPVDLFVPGCPPPADAIYYVISELLAGNMPDPGALTRFGR
ncbi:MAG: NADP oxidoreductase [Anaerolineae bacterium]